MLYIVEAHLDPPVQGAETVLSCADFALGDMTVELNRPRLFRDGAALHMVFEKTRSLFTNIHENCIEVKSHLGSHLLTPETRLYTQHTHRHTGIASSNAMGEVTDVRVNRPCS
jgi:hypothetical protein